MRFSLQPWSWGDICRLELRWRCSALSVVEYLNSYLSTRETNLLCSWYARRLRSSYIFLASSTAATSPHCFIILTCALLCSDNFATVCTVRNAVCLFTHLNTSSSFFPHKNHSKLQDDSINLPSRLLLTEFRSLVVSHPRQNSLLPGNTSYGGKKNFKTFKKVSVFF